MRKRHRSCAAPFAAITAGLFLFTACHVVDDRRDTSCRSAGTAAVELVAAVEGRGGSGGGGGSRGSSSRSGNGSGNAGDGGDGGTVQRPGGAVDTRKRPPARDQVRKEPAPPRRDRAYTSTPSPAGTTATPTPSPSGSCK